METETVIAFLQSLGGKVDLTPFEPPVQVASGISQTPERKLTGDARRGRRIFEEKMKCNACHRVYGSGGEGGPEGEVGPDLSDIGALNTVDYLEESMLFPDASIVKGFAWASLRLKDGRKVEGTLVEEDEGALILRIKKEEVLTVSKDEIQERRIRRPDDLTEKGYFWVRASLSDGRTVEGDLAEEDGEEMVLRVGEETRSIPKGDIAHLEGKRIRIKSKMPGNYGDLLRVREFNDLLAYLAGLKGAPAGENP